MRENLGLEVGDVLNFAQNWKKGNIFAFGGFLFMFLNFTALGNETKKRKIHPNLLIPIFLLTLPSGNYKHKRKFIEIRNILLKTLSKENELTLNELAVKSNLSWKTAKLHLIYLKGKGLVIETLSTPYVRMFKITQNGIKISKENLNRI